MSDGRRAKGSATTFSELGLIDDDGTLRCGWHYYWGFDLDSGRHTQVGGIRVGTFPTRVVDGAIEVDVARSPHLTAAGDARLTAPEVAGPLAPPLGGSLAMPM